MPILKRTDNTPYSVIFHCNLSGTEVLFKYRMPTTDERNKYNNTAVQRMGKRGGIVIKTAEAQERYGYKILSGIREGDFLIPLDNHEGYHNNRVTEEENTEYPGYLTISSDKGSKYYVSDWKKQVHEIAPHLIIHLGRHVFDSPSDDTEQDDMEDFENP